VKVQGNRVELSEIEAALRAQAGVREAVVLATESADAVVSLAAVYTGEPLPTNVLRQRIGAQLAPYMVPRRLIWIDSLPVGSNGKIDRDAIRRRYLDPAAGDGHVPARDSSA
jgi:acyl-coenzyme A synthetase/AMP-(fatty) acid ligase